MHQKRWAAIQQALKILKDITTGKLRASLNKNQHGNFYYEAVVLGPSCVRSAWIPAKTNTKDGRISCPNLTYG